MVERIDRSQEEFENELREQLRARSAPPGFADRVMVRVEQPRRPARQGFFLFRPLWGWGAVAALLALTVFGGVEHDRQQRIAGEHARQQVLLALRITGTTFRQVQAKVNDTTPSPQPSGGTNE